MRRKLIHGTIAVVVGTACALPVYAQVKPDVLVKQRQSAMVLQGKYFYGHLRPTAQGKMPYDANEFSMRADRVAMIAPLLTEAYPPETKGAAGSKLKPEMWDNRADFDAKLKNLVDKTASLATAAKAGDFGKSKAAFFEAGDACKSCHDKYREE